MQICIHYLQLGSGRFELSLVTQQCAEVRIKFSVLTMRWEVGEDTFDLDEQYEVLKYLGCGAYGIVVSVYDKKKHMEVAVKKCKRVFHSTVIAKRTLRELRIVRSLSHPNVIQILNVHYPSNTESFEEIYISFELMETDLASIIRSPQTLTDDHIQLFMYQLLKGCHFLHDHDILHRDLKPRNILVNSNCLLKLADFGLAKVVNNSAGDVEKIAPMTEYVTSRWYCSTNISDIKHCAQHGHCNI